jgi:hypothetical protein
MKHPWVQDGEITIGSIVRFKDNVDLEWMRNYLGVDVLNNRFEVINLSSDKLYTRIRIRDMLFSFYTKRFKVI